MGECSRLFRDIFAQARGVSGLWVAERPHRQMDAVERRVQVLLGRIGHLTVVVEIMFGLDGYEVDVDVRHIEAPIKRPIFLGRNAS